MIRYARSWWEQFMGLMFDTSPGAQLEFEFSHPTRFGASIHTMFMNYPIRATWLDEKRNVLEEKTFKPWMIHYTPKHASKYLIEKRID